MKKNISKGIVRGLFVAMTLLVSGCHTDVDFSNIDKTAQVGMSLALPIGTVSATISDFIGNETIQQYLKTDENGVLTLHYEMELDRPFTEISLDDYKANADVLYNISSTDLTIVGAPGLELAPITIPLQLTMANCNTVDNINSYARIDSLAIKRAQFSTTLSLNSLDIPKEYIKDMKIILGDAFNTSIGKIIPLQFNDWGEPMIINVEDFLLDMTLDNTLSPTTKQEADANVTNEISAKIQFNISIPQGASLSMKSNSTIHAVVQTDVLEFNALWGYFFPGNQMREKGSEDLSELFELNHNITKYNLMLADPSIQLSVSSSVLAPISVFLDELSVTIKNTGDTYYALFENGKQSVWEYITHDDYNNYLSSEPGTLFTSTYTLSSDPAHGDLSRLFQTVPDVLNYDFNIDIAPQYTNLQHRIVPDLDVNLNMAINIPLSFNKGMELAYSDTLDNVDIAFNLDQMISEIEVIDSLKASDAIIRILAQSTIPLDVKLAFQFLDENDKEIDFNDFIDNQTILISAPTEYVDGKVDEEHPGENDIIITISKEEFDKLHQVRKIAYQASISANDDVFKNNDVEKISLLASSGLKIKVGVAASLEAILNLEFDN